MSRNSSLRNNIAALYVVQIASYAAPLATLPWLIRVLGPAGFGRVSFCASVIGYFVLFTDYGFNLSATRQIAMRWDDPAGRSAIFWNTITMKGVLAGIGLPCLGMLTIVVPRFAEERTLLLINYLTVLGTVLSPLWYFQGTERQAILSAITVGVRLIAVPAVFLLVRAQSDVEAAALISCGTHFVTGLLCFCWVVLRNGEVDRFKLEHLDLRAVLKDGWHLFLSTAFQSLFTATNTVILGFVAGSAAVGHYAAAEKLIQLAQGVLTPINQSVYPRVSRLMKESRASAFALIRKVLRIQGAIAFMLSFVLLAVAPPLIRLLYGAAYEQTIGVLRWLAFLPLLAGLSSVLGVHTMLAMGMKQTVSRILVSAGLINVLTLFLLSRWYGAVGAAMAVVATEFFVTVTMAAILRHRHVPIFRAPVLT